MNKKIICISFLIVFLMLSVSMVCAEDDDYGIQGDDGSQDNYGTQDITVKLKWVDSKNLPESVTVKLLKDGNVVDTKTLNSKNSWSATFTNQDTDGTYTVNVTDSSKYTTSVSGNANSGFEITGKIIKDDKSSDATHQTNNVEKNQSKSNFPSSGDLLKQVMNNTAVSNSTNNSTNGTNVTPIDNSTDDNNTDDNSTDDTNGTSKDNSTDKSNSTIIDDTTETETITTITKVSEIIKETFLLKEPANHTIKHDLKNTGLPIALVLVAFAVLIAGSIIRKK